MEDDAVEDDAVEDDGSAEGERSDDCSMAVLWRNLNTH